MLIIHGDDKVTSYRRLTEISNTYRDRQIEIIIYDPQDLDITTMRQELSSGLFGVSKCLIIKNLLSTTKSKAKDKIIDLLKSDSTQEVILYENKSVSATNLKPFSKTKVEAFEISPIIFKFVDCLRPRNIRQILLGWKKLIDGGNEPEYIFAMVTRQFRMLIQAKSGASYLKAGYNQKRAVVAQAEHYSLEQLILLHTFLYEIDKKIKTGGSPLGMDQLLPNFFQKI
jgi:DNA polymerase III delta subunit